MVDRCGTWMVGVCLGAAILVSHGCSRTPSRVTPPPIDGQAAGEAAMAKYDANQDGKIAGAELDAVPAVKKSLKLLDKDGDNAVSAKEIADRIAQWQADGTALTTMGCTATLRNAPLADAKIVLEPEAFLGENIKAAEGTTDQRGRVSLAIPGGKTPGVAFGFYKIRITSDKAKIPAKYNDETALGVEIGPGAPELENGEITLDLK